MPAVQTTYRRHVDATQRDEVTDDMPVEFLTEIKQTFYKTK